MPILENPIIIKYEGLDADKHEIELSSFAESLKGLEKIISVAANFAVSQRYVKRRDAMVGRVMATTPSEGSFDFPVIFSWISQNGLASTTVGGLIVVLVSYIFSRLCGTKKENEEQRKALEAALKERGNTNEAVIHRLLDTIDNMAVSLRPATKQALTPIGKSASSLSVSSKDQKIEPFVVGKAEKKAVLSDTRVLSGTHVLSKKVVLPKKELFYEQPVLLQEVVRSEDTTETLDEMVYDVRFHEMNKDTKTCRISFLNDDGSRITAVINDPCFKLEENNYIKAFANNTYIPVKARAIVKKGKIIQLVISNLM